MTGRTVLTEEELLALSQYLNKLDEDLSMHSTDHQPLMELLSHVTDRLRDIAWEKYKKENKVDE